MKRFDAKFRFALAFLVTLGLLVLCFELVLFLWQDRLTNNLSRLDLILAPITLTLGVVIGAITGRWRFQALQELAPRFSDKILWREKSVLTRSEFGQKALGAEGHSYAALFYLFLAIWALTKAEFMPVGAAAFFALGLWLAGQTIPYFRFSLWQYFSRSEEALEVSDDQVIHRTEVPAGRNEQALKDQIGTESQKRFDPRIRIALILIGAILCLMSGWSLPNERSLGISGLFGIALILTDVIVGLAVGAVIGRWRLLGLREVSTHLGGKIIFLEPNLLSGSVFGQRAIQTEKIVISLAGLTCIVWGTLAKSVFLSVDVLIYFLLGLLLTSQATSYTVFWLTENRNIS